MGREAEQKFSSHWGVFLLWSGWAIGPLAWILHLSIAYLLAPWVCLMDSNLPLYLLTGAALLIAAVGVFLNWHLWEQVGMQWAGDGHGPSPRSRFMSLIGLLSSVLFFFIILAQGIPIIVLGPCA